MGRLAGGKALRTEDPAFQAAEAGGEGGGEIITGGNDPVIRISPRAAQNAGTDFAAVTTGTTTAAEFKSFPHVKIMKSLAELID